MTFDEILEQVTDLLRRHGRVSYRALKLRFNLDDEFLAGLKDELIAAQRLASDEDGKVLVWAGEGAKQETETRRLGETEKEQTTASDARRQTLDPRRDAGERRQLTVMFCDLVGSTPLSEKLDPEELRAVILAYQEACAIEIRRFEGYIARYVGDGLLVYFSYPQAHEDDAQRAVRAGLGIVAALPHLNTRLQQTVGVLRASPLQVRIGIHTGLVVVSDMGGGGYRDPMAIVGETPNIAARLQGLAEPDTVVISQATYKLIQGYFEYQGLGPQTLKGISIPLSVYRVVREGEAQSRFEAAVSKGLTPLVGREEELGLLRRRWEQAKAGEGQVVLLSGEPGIGKSRLVQTLKEQATTEGATRIEFRCSAYHQNSAFYPIIEHLQRLLQFASHDTSQVKLAKLQQTLAHYHFPQADTLPLLASLLSLPHPEGAPPITVSPQKQKQKTQEALVAWSVEEAEKAAVYCVWEDLHWADPSTLEVLTLFLDQVPTTRLLTLLTFRPDFTPPWRPHSHVTQLTLSRLGRPQVEMMVERVTAGKPLPAEVMQQIVTKTDGVPLFVEELTKMVVESGLLREEDGHYVGAHGGALLPPLAIPSTLQDSLMARLDRLAPIRELVQLGATLGREFSYELLHAVSPLDEGTLQQGLRQLVEAEFVYQRGLLPQATYLFKHALIQDTAYQSLLKSTRQQYHKKIAQVLEEQFAETKETQPELLAHHYTEAGLKEQALPYWQQAGQRAIQRSANAEAVAHLMGGLGLLQTQSDSLERAKQELSLQLALGPALMATKSIGHSDVERTYSRARALCQQIGETPQLFPVLWGLLRFHSLRADYQAAQELNAQLLRLAQSAQDPALLLQARLGQGLTLFFLGQMISARDCFAQVITLYNPQQHHSHAFLYGYDPGVANLSYAAMTLWHLGYPDQALQESQRALVLAQELTHPFSVVYALSCSAWVHHLRREAHGAQEQIEKAIGLATEQGFPHWMAWGSILRGWALAMQGQREGAIVQMPQDLATLRVIGGETGRTWYLAMLAEAYETGCQSEEGLHVLAEALDMVDQRGERAYEAELYRLKGTLTLQSKVPSPKSQVEKEAEECFLKAIEIARRQSAKSLELRAVMSLSRLWQRQGKKDEARQGLAEIYGWFTEGFDTVDLKEAKALLEELSRN
ncbi:MAG TPA: adenylate/guanylate cyclase domain-containing protein [Candidatus Binatia bacterium]|jgi:TOMM system kinase/cyclase fusion protein|nr:adenylate/guanylate cyclase domain-containing protein [Candidatus Binatia bacterium]